MKRFFKCVCAAVACCLVTMLAACRDRNSGDAVPQKLKDGEAISLILGESNKLDISEYISEVDNYTYTVTSSDDGILTVALDGSIATFTAISGGNAVVTASSGEVFVEFFATVYGPPPVFDDVSIKYDLFTADSAEIALAPGSGESSYIYSYELKFADDNITIAGDKLIVSYSTVVEKTVVVVATYIDDENIFAFTRTVEFAVNISVTDSTPSVKSKSVKQTVDLFGFVGDEYDGMSGVWLDFTENIFNPAGLPLAISVTADGESIELSADNRLFVPISGPCHTEFYVVANFGADKQIDYSLTLEALDTTEYRAVNGGFDIRLGEDGCGWTIGGDIGKVVEANGNNYFFGNEQGMGTLASSSFKIGGIGKISFKLGAADNPKCYITLEDDAGEVVRIWRNYNFAADNTQTMMTYIADLKGLAGDGKSYRLVLHDEAERDFGYFLFDDLVTYYASEDDLPTASDAVNELADKSKLKTLIANAIASQGDYTDASYLEYSQCLAAARELNDWVAARQSDIDAAITKIKTAQENLVVRVPTEIDGANKSFKIFGGDSIEINIADYVDENGLSAITYSARSEDPSYLLCGSISSDKSFMLVAQSFAGSRTVHVVIEAKYKGVTVLTVTLSVVATNELAPTVKEQHIMRTVDLYTETNKTDITIDFASNINNPSVLTLEYSATMNGTPIELAHGAKYNYAYGNYTGEVVFKVKVSFTIDGESQFVEFNYTLTVLDTRAYMIVNGGFENGLDGWTKTGNIGDASSDEYYYGDSMVGVEFGMDGEKMFSAYAGLGNASATGTLTSSAFVVGGSGWITYKLGAARPADLVYIEIVENGTNAVLERFGNHLWAQTTDGVLSCCTLIPYRANLSALLGKSVYIRIVDKATVNHGMIFADSFVTYYAQEPSGDDFKLAVSDLARKYRVANGGFGTGNLDSWELLTDGMKCAVGNDTHYWADKLPFNNDGYFLKGDIDDGDESDTWTVRSSTFEIGGSGWISLRMGGHAAVVKIYKAGENGGELIGEYAQNHFADVNFPIMGDGTNSGSWYDMRTYFIDLSDFIGETLYIELCDEECAGFAGAVFDEVNTYYEAAPDTDGYDTVRAPIGRDADGDLIYGNVQLKWRIAEKRIS